MKQNIEGFRLSPQQEHLWSLVGSGTPQPYRSRCTVRLDGSLDPAALEQAVREAVARHEILRTRFLALPGMAFPLQVIGASAAASPSLHLLDPGSAEEVEALLAGARRAEIDLESGAPLGAVLVRLSPSCHLLELSLPALCADRAALGHLVREISAAYARHREARGAAPGEPVQYVDAAEVFHELLESEDTKKGRDHWSQQDLSSLLEPSLPGQHDAGGGFAPGVVARALETGTAEAVDGLARHLGVSASSFFLACWQILLGRVTRTQSPVLGVACDGRTYEDLQGSVGLFARHVPFCAGWQGRPRFAELWRRSEEALAEIRRRQDFFAWKLLPGEPAAGGAFFPFCFESEEREAPWPAGGLVFSLAQCQAFFDRFRVKLCCVRRASDVAIELAFDSQALPAAEAERLLERYCALVASAAALPESGIEDLDIVSPSERQKLLVEINDTAVSSPDLCLHELFEAQAERTPGKVAVVWEGGELTYADLRSRADRLSRRLRRLGAEPESRVAVYAERSPEMLVGLLAVLGAGAAYVPLDPSSPRERLEWMLGDSRPVALLMANRFAAAAPAGGPPVVTFEEDLYPETPETPEAPGAAAMPAHPAYVIYTSGSTGRPKGVVVSHRAIVNRLLWMQRRLPLDADDVLVHKTLFSFDASIWEIFVPLAAGATLVLARPDGHLDPSYLAGLVAARRATVLQLVPSMLRVFLEEPGVERCTSLRRVFCGGEALTADLRERFFSRLAAELHNLYGPTECAIDVTHWRCRPAVGAADTAADAAAGAIVPIGRPIDNVRVYVLDAAMRPVPEGVAGELFVGGAGLARGYLGRPDLTAERFLPDPCGDVPGARLYRTGDLVRHLPEESLGFLGRTDQQVKIRGFRIELGEIEAALAAFPALLEAAVATWDGEAVGTQLVAYVVTRPGEEPEAMSLQAFLAGRLPEYMVPALFVRLPALPRLSNGKLDRRALPAPDRERMGLGHAFLAARTRTEEALAGIWSEVLGRERVGVHDDFFDLGGHSLLATRVVTRIREELRCEVSLRLLFDTRTVAAIAAAIDESQARQERSEVSSILPTAGESRGTSQLLNELDELAADDPMERLASLPPEKQKLLLRRIEQDGGASDAVQLSFAQERLWFLHRLAPGSSSYNLPSAIRFSGKLDVAVMAGTRDEIVRRHEVLRTTFPTLCNHPIQLISPFRSRPLPVVDLAALPPTSRDAEARALAAAEARRPFDLSRGPLMRLALLRLEDEDCIVLLTMHHIISDGWSVGVYMQEFAVLYEELRAGRPSPLPDLPIQYKDFSRWQRRWLSGERLEAELAYWEEQLKGAPAGLDLPADRTRPPVPTFRGDLVLEPIPGPVAERLRSMSSAQGTTLFMTLLAAFEALLFRYTQQEDLIVGTAVANRNRAEIEKLIGFFVNTLALRTDLSNDPSFRDLAGRVRDVTLGAQAHQNLPFERLVAALHPERNLSRSPLFQVAFDLQNAAAAVPQIRGLALRPLASETGTAKLDLRLSLREMEQGLEAVFEYSTDLFDATTIARMSRHLRTLLESIVANPGRALSALDLLTEEELHQSLAEWNDTGGEIPASGGMILEVFEEQAARRPDTVAVVFEGECLTYRELDRRANQLAHHLRASGIGREAPVAICLERSLEMVIALLGVLKSGGFYLPLDPDYPRERLAFMLEDTGASVVLTLERCRRALPAHGRRTICLDTEWASIAAEPGERPAVRPEPGQIFCVIYTSGSTGRPKGVMVHHQGLFNRLLWAQRAYPVTSADRVLQKASFSFDFSIWECLGPLLAGARLVLARPGGQRDGAYLVDTVKSRDITLLHFVPSMLQPFLEARGVEECASLRFVFSGGEALSPELQELFFSRLGRAPLLLRNQYGPTEISIDTTEWVCRRGERLRGSVPIGRPLANAAVYLLDPRLQPVPAGAVGELFLGGAGVVRGYLSRPALTAERFLPDPFGTRPGGRLYRTGDLGRHRPDGNIEFLGRIDHQVKVRGYRIELGEIEAVLYAHPGVREAAVSALGERSEQRRIVAYAVPETGREPAVDETELKAWLEAQVPRFMVPSAVVLLDALPRMANGKLDRSALPDPKGLRTAAVADHVLPRSEMEQSVAAVWRELLEVERIGIYDNFFDLGGNSLLLAKAHGRLQEAFGGDVTLIDLFKYPTVHSLAAFLRPTTKVLDVPRREPPEQEPSEARAPRPASAEDSFVAVIGLSLRVPGARSPEELWRNLCAGVESIQFPTDGELLALGASPGRLRDPRYVKARSCLGGIDLFDADFFRLSPMQAALMDPQQRFFLECAWEALENAGYGAGIPGRRVGVYAGKGANTYIFNLFSNPEIMESVGLFQTSLVNEKDHLAPRVSYLFDLEGPSVTVQTACSTSLVAVHLACQSLLGGECEMALAGGVSIDALPQVGYLYQEGGISSPDGHCRPFDAGAGGTISASGVGVVVLKRLGDALADGDTIHAVIRGSAINNDGAAKVGYTAPRIEGQARAIREAQRKAGIQADDVTYIEAHGTATELGDPIEIAALTQAFRATTARTGFCALGSVKSNFGHCDTASGVVGLIKTVLSLEHGALPPSLHFRRPNPKIDLEHSPFYVNAKLTAWERGERPRRAGVSSFGIGGTNAHVVVEEAPGAPAAHPSRPWQMLMLSARTGTALEAAAEALGEHLRRRPEEAPLAAPLADIAYTLQIGRSVFSHRRVVLCRDTPEAVAALGSPDTEQSFSRESELRDQPFVFLFPGQGSQHVDMGRELYATEPVFRREVDRACGLLRPALGLDLREILYPHEMPAEEAARRLGSTALAQPALFVVEHALARLWMSWLGSPAAMIGHSLGEYVAACLAGVLSLEQALTLVAARGRLMAETRPGAMLAVPLGEEEVLALAEGGLSLAAVNSRSRCVVSGSEEAVEALRDRLFRGGLECRRLPTSHAFHSSLMDPILEPFTRAVREVDLQPPRIPYISDVTGTWITADQATDPAYWREHLRRPVRFEDGLRELWRSSEGVLLEAGPGRSLAALASRHPGRPAEREVLSSLGHPREPGSDLRHLLTALGRLWLAGVTVDWPAFYAGERRRRVPLPTYPFERRRHWIDAGAHWTPAARGTSGRFQAPAWRRSLEIPAAGAEPAGSWLLFLDACGVGEELARRLEERGEVVVTVAPGAPEDHASLVRRLRGEGRLPTVVAHLGSVTAEPLPAGAGSPAFDSLLSLVRAFQTESPGVSQTIGIVSNHLHAVTGDEALCPAKAGVLALCELPELPGVSCRNIDIALPAPGARDPLLRLLEAELAGPGAEPVIALRGRFRWERVEEAVRLDGRGDLAREDGAWLVTAGPAARSLAAEIARSVSSASQTARVALAAGLPELRTDPRAEAPRLRELEAELGRAMRVEWMSDREGLEATLGRLCSRLVLDYFRRGGVLVAPGEVWREEELRRTLRIVPAFRRFLDLFLAMLQQDGLLAVDGESLLVLPAVTEVEPAEALADTVARRYPEYAGLVRLLSGCVSRYGEALSGDIPAIEVLYPQGRRSTALDEDDSPRARQGLYIELLCRFLTRLADEHPDRELRILEVGAGTGFLTRAVLAALAGRRVSYTFTDIGRTFVRAAELAAERQGAGGMSFRVLDISADPARQGFETEAYDAVLGFNVVHATADLGESVGHLTRLLGPGGILALVEAVKPAPWIDLIWGLAEGWWSFTDREIRQISPLVGLDTWERVLRAQGLESIVGFPEEAERSRHDFGLILGRKGAAPEQEDLGNAALLLSSQGLGDAVRETRRRLGDLRRVLCVDPGAADLGDLAALLDEPGVEVVAVSSSRPAGIAERGLMASLATLAARPEGRLRLLRWQERPSAREITEVLERALSSAVTDVVVFPSPAEALAAEPAPAAGASRPQERANAIETRITEIWRELLGTRLGLRDNFFEKGADSLAMLSLTAKIRDTWQVDLPLRLVLEAPTVAELALKVGGELARREAEAHARETSRTLVEIQAGRPERVPFFTVHAAGGNVLCYYNLARHLGSDRPVYALQAPGVEQGEEKIFTRLEDLACHHVAAIRAFRPHGPYLLGGWSAGGTIAFEMAQQLVRMGEEVLLVALMDTYAPQVSEGFDETRMLLWQAWRFNITMTPEDLEGLPGFDAGLDRIVDLAFERGAIPPQLERGQARRLLAVEIANLQAILDYRAQPYPGRLSYFHCAEGTDFGEFARLFPRINEMDHAAGWIGFSPQPMPVFDIPGDHAAMMDEPAVGVLARHLKDCFAEVERELLVGLGMESKTRAR